MVWFIMKCLTLYVFDILMYTFIMTQIAANQTSPTSFSSSYPWNSKRGMKRMGEKLSLGNTYSYKYHNTYSAYNANLFGIGFVLNHVCTCTGRVLLLTWCYRICPLESSLCCGVPLPVQCHNSARCTKGHRTISLEGA